MKHTKNIYDHLKVLSNWVLSEYRHCQIRDFYGTIALSWRWHKITYMHWISYLEHIWSQWPPLDPKKCLLFIAKYYLLYLCHSRRELRDISELTKYCCFLQNSGFQTFFLTKAHRSDNIQNFIHTYKFQSLLKISQQHLKLFSINKQGETLA